MGSLSSSDGVATIVDGSTRTDERTPAPGRGPSALPTSVRVGRYTILMKLGSGGMGVVYSAYDDTLDRKVAIKLLRADRDPERDRMRREAQALARLSDPHVVQIYEVGEHYGAMFVAMEYIAGQNLREWLRAEARPWREVVRMFRQAGAGLLAAHDVGLVHRDFKPDNVMVGDDGRARVLDFGLARSLDAVDGEATGEEEVTRQRALVEAPQLEGTQENHALSTALTSPGTLLGTPPYMSPEQLLATSVTALSDQFSFCVALYEALYRQRPFQGKSRQELESAIVYGPLPDAPAGADVPSWLRRVVARGLSKRPGERWPSMAELLEALAQDPARTRRRRLGAVALSLGLVAAGASAALYSEESAPCTGADATLADAWSDASRAAVVASFAATEAEYSERAAEQVVQRLDDYADEWATLRAEGCAAHLDGQRSDSLWDHQVSCFARRRVDLTALIEVLRDADEQVVRRAVTAARGLPALSGCADLEALTAELPPAPEAQREEVERVRDQLSKIRALDKTGRYEQARALARAAVERAESLDYARLRAEALFQRGGIEERLTSYDEAAATLQDAYFLAEEARDDRLAVDIATLLVFVIGYGKNSIDEGLLWGRQARAKLARVGGADDSRRASLLSHEGTLLNERGRYEAAEAKFLEALPILARFGELEQISVLANLAIAQSRQRRREESLANFRRLYEIVRENFGPGHPESLMASLNLAHALNIQGENDEARRLLESALERAPATFGPEHATTANMWSALAKIQHEERDLRGALRSSERALEIGVAAVGPENRRVAGFHVRKGMISESLGERDAAARAYAAALAIYAKLYPDGHPVRGETLRLQAELALERGELETARSSAEDALRMMTAARVGELDIANCQHALASALWAEGSEPARADELSAAAARVLCGAPGNKRCEKIRAARSKHGLSAARAAG